MLSHILRRLGQAALVLWAAFSVAFVLLQVFPGDAIQIKFQSPDLGLSPDQIAAIRASYGVDEPILWQYVQALGHVLTGDFGYSVQAGVPVAARLAAALPTTLRLTALGFLAAFVIAGLVTAAAILGPWRGLRGLIASLPSLFVSVPTFWLAIVLIQIFSFRLKLVPVIGAGPWEGLILPIATIAVPISAPLAQVLIRSLEAVERLPFVPVARAKGATRVHVLGHHVLRNALPPVLTLAGMIFGELLTSAIVTETVFGLNGLGRLTADAVNNQDASVLQAVVLLSAAGFVAVNLAVDLILPLIDPRLLRKVEVRA